MDQIVNLIKVLHDTLHILDNDLAFRNDEIGPDYRYGRMLSSDPWLEILSLKVYSQRFCKSLLERL